MLAKLIRGGQSEGTVGLRFSSRRAIVDYRQPVFLSVRISDALGLVSR